MTVKTSFCLVGMSSPLQINRLGLLEYKNYFNSEINAKIKRVDELSITVGLNCTSLYNNPPTYNLFIRMLFLCFH